MNNKFLPDINRVIDANINRTKEGIRVVEDIMRYYFNDIEISLKLKSLRHKSKIDLTSELLKNRDSTNDVLRKTTDSELLRESIKSIAIANFKRAQESSRVLEELYKLQNLDCSENFKNIRYELYMLEKDVVLKYFN